MAAGRDSGGGSGERAEASRDEDLALRVQRGDRAALEELVRRYVRPIHAVVAGYLSEPADIEDAAQETFLRALGAIGGYDPGRPFAPWLYQIARNVARSRGAARARGPTEIVWDALESPRAGPDVAVERAEVRERVSEAMARLPERQRTAFRLSDVEGYPTGEVARLMGLSPGTVRSHVHHARKALRVALGEGTETANPRKT